MARQLNLRRWVFGFIVGLSSITLAMGAPVDVQPRDIFVVMGDTAPASRQMADALVKKIRNAKIISDVDAPLQKRRNTLCIAVGHSALQSLVTQNNDAAILAVLTSSLAFRSIVESNPKSRGRDISAIYADASPVSQLKLAASLTKNRANMVTFLSPRTGYLRATLARAAAQAGLDLEIVQLSGDESLTQELDQSTAARGVLALPDSTLFTPENIRAMLITTYRQNQFVIGYSSSFVKAGALAATYSTIDDISSQAAEVVRDYYSAGRFPAPQYPKYFAVSVNDSVARSLNIIISDEARNLSHKPTEPPP